MSLTLQQFNLSICAHSLTYTRPIRLMSPMNKLHFIWSKHHGMSLPASVRKPTAKAAFDVLSYENNIHNCLLAAL